MLKGDEDKAKNYMNVAIELDRKVYKQFKKDPIFTPIREEITPPEQEIKHEEEKIKKKLSKKERKASSHLSKTCLLVESLSNEDLAVLRNRKQKQKYIEFDQKEKGQE